MHTKGEQVWIILATPGSQLHITHTHILRIRRLLCVSSSKSARVNRWKGMKLVKQSCSAAFDIARPVHDRYR